MLLIGKVPERKERINVNAFKRDRYKKERKKERKKNERIFYFCYKWKHSVVEERGTFCWKKLQRNKEWKGEKRVFMLLIN